MLVVSDTSPLRALHHLQLVPILPALFDEIFIPPAVATELESGSATCGPVDLAAYPFLQRRAPKAIDPNLAAGWELDIGETEAIALAIELSADTLLVDELEARRVATQLGIEIVGVLGLLVDATRHAMLPAVRPLMEARLPHLRHPLRPHPQDDQ